MPEIVRSRAAFKYEHLLSEVDNPSGLGILPVSGIHVLRISPKFIGVGVAFDHHIPVQGVITASTCVLVDDLPLIYLAVILFEDATEQVDEDDSRNQNRECDPEEFRSVVQSIEPVRALIPVVITKGVANPPDEQSERNERTHDRHNNSKYVQHLKHELVGECFVVPNQKVVHESVCSKY